MTFKENLQTLRKLNHLSQEKLAQKVGVSRQSVSKWETGEAYPEMANILAICKIFHCKITDLIDINSKEFKDFDAETRKNLVDLNEKDRRRLKKISKIIYITTRIIRIVSLSNFIVIGALAYIMYYAVINWLVSGFPDWATQDDLTVINFIKFGALPKALVILLIFGLLITTAIYIYKTLLEVERFFKRIHDNKSPFSLENTLSLKKIARFIVIWLVADNLAKLIATLLIPGASLTFNIASVAYALIIVALVYIFRYGYLLQNQQNQA